MNRTNINWCDMSWNPFVGCKAGCDYCYARKLHEQRQRAWWKGAKLPEQYMKSFTEIQCFPGRLDDPVKRKRPTIIFCGSMGDIASVPDDFKHQIFDRVHDCPQHHFMFLTKFPLELQGFDLRGFGAHDNLWMGATATSARTALHRVPQLLNIKAPRRFLSIEPMTGPISLWSTWLEHLDLVICGGMTGKHSDPIDIQWVRELRDDCAKYGVQFHFKQWGDNPTEDSYQQRHGINAQIHLRHNGRLLDGRVYDWHPEGWDR